MHDRQLEEFALRLPAQSPAEILQSATSVAARLLRAEGQIGVLAPGALADVLLVEGDPTREITMWQEPRTGIALLMQGGRVVRSSVS
jgi:imidazolonepropionase-like amidohydrolase